MHVKQTIKNSLFILFLAFTTLVYSQNESLNSKISINTSRASLVDIFSKISNKSDIKFTYGTDVIEHKGRYSINEESSSIRSILDNIGSQANLNYLFDANNVAVNIDNQKQNKNNPTNQPKKVTGIVTDDNGLPLLGTSIVEKGTRNGTQTSLDGAFSLTVSSDQATLVVSYIGFKTKEIKVQGQESLAISLEEDIDSLDEVVVVGYGSINKKNLTGSVSKVNSSVLEELPDVSFQNKLSGKLAGVTIRQTTGAPGGNISIRVRGLGSITAGNNPLIVIDGFPISDGHDSANVQGNRPGNGPRQENPQNPLSTLNPNDIESVEVLKDAAAAAIYGSRGANGVILITTKRGIEGKPSFNFNSSVGTQTVTKTYDMMDAYQFAEQNYISRRNSGTLSGYRPEWIPYLNDEPGLVNTDWQDELFRSALWQNYDLSVKGGTKKAKYYVSGNYANEEGTIIGSGFQRYSMRANFDAELSDKIRFGVNFSPSISISELVPSDNPYFVDGVVNLALLSLPTESVYNPDGSFNYNQNTAAGSGPFVNPVAIASLIDDELKQTRMLMGSYFEVDVLQDFTFKTQFGFDFNNWNRAYYRPSDLPVRGTPAPSDPEGRNFSTQTYNWVLENTLAYDKTFNDKHHLNILIGHTAQKNLFEKNGIVGTGYPNDLVQTLNASTEITGWTQRIEEWSLISYLSRLSYDYEGKYLLSASFRRDGASRFGPNTKWGNFPSISAGWRISGMDFFKSDVINDFKLRASYGETGNFSIPNYGAIALLGQSNYVFDDALANGIAPVTSPNTDLSWEKNSSYNYGLDISLFNNKLVINSDYFISTTKDLLIQLPVPASSGFNSSLQNIGEMENRGFELGVTHNLNAGDFRMTTNANLSTVKNKVLSLGGLGQIIENGGVTSTHITKVGEPLGSYYGLNVLGVYTTQEELDTFPHQSDAALGDFIFEDVNGDGLINGDDRKILGDFFPDYTFGFTSQLAYKNFDFSFTIEGKQNFEILHLSQRYLGSLQTFSNYRADIFENAYISPERPGNGQVYRPNASPTNDNDAISSYHIEDGSYVRIQNLTLGYSFGEEVLQQLGNLKKLRLYATATNLVTFTDYPGFNPDVNQRPGSALTQGEDYGTYPLSTNILLGVNLSF